MQNYYASTHLLIQKEMWNFIGRFSLLYVKEGEPLCMKIFVVFTFAVTGRVGLAGPSVDEETCWILVTALVALDLPCLEGDVPVMILLRFASAKRMSPLVNILSNVTRK